jgi:thioredoxin
MNKKISGKELRKEVMENSVLSLVKFKTDWSGSCQIISPVYEELANYYKGQVNFYNLDIENEPELENDFGVIEIPTILFFKRGEVIDHISGLVPKNIIITKIENALAKSAN